MADITIEAQFPCRWCDELHDDEDEAILCCSTSIDAIYTCPICKERHPAEKLAIDCCGFDPETNPAPISAEELEAHGQLRLESV